MDEETKAQLAKLPKKKWRVQRWNAWYDTVMFMSMMGAETKDIAKKLHKSVTLINNLKNAKEYLSRYQGLVDIRKNAYVDVMQEMNAKKKKVFGQLMFLIFNADSDTTKASLTTWFLERFPEFSVKGREITLNNNTFQATPEQLEQQKIMVNELKELKKLITNGNPYVVEIEGEILEQSDENDKNSSGQIDIQQEKETAGIAKIGLAPHL